MMSRDRETIPMWTSFVAASPAKTSRARASDAASAARSRRYGGTTPTSFGAFGLASSSSKMSRTGKITGCHTSDISCTCSAIERAPWGLPPGTLELPMVVPASSLLATPTETANQLAPSMVRQPSFRRMQELCGTGGLPHPHVYEWLMGFVEDWTDIESEPSETPLSPSAPKSSAA